MPGVPNITFSIVDVRDVAAAQLAAMEKPEAAGNRYILSSEVMSFQEIAQTISQEFRPQGYKIPTGVLPKAVVWLGKFFKSGLNLSIPKLANECCSTMRRCVTNLEWSPGQRERV